jgi:hypothetical protein
MPEKEPIDLTIPIDPVPTPTPETPKQKTPKQKTPKVEQPNSDPTPPPSVATPPVQETSPVVPETPPVRVAAKVESAPASVAAPETDDFSLDVPLADDDLPPPVAPRRAAPVEPPRTAPPAPPPPPVVEQEPIRQPERIKSKTKPVIEDEDDDEGDEPLSGNRYVKDVDADKFIEHFSNLTQFERPIEKERLYKVSEQNIRLEYYAAAEESAATELRNYIARTGKPLSDIADEAGQTPEELTRNLTTKHLVAMEKRIDKDLADLKVAYEYFSSRGRSLRKTRKDEELRAQSAKESEQKRILQVRDNMKHYAENELRTEIESMGYTTEQYSSVYKGLMTDFKETLRSNAPEESIKRTIRRSVLAEIINQQPAKELKAAAKAAAKPEVPPPNASVGRGVFQRRVQEEDPFEVKRNR